MDHRFDAYAAVDAYKSLIWAERYSKCGDFELYIPATKEAFSLLKKNDYVRIRDSERYMIIETIDLQTDAEVGDYISITGRSLESILERRIIWGMTVLAGDFQTGIKTLLDRNVISPDISERKIPNFTFKESTDPRITSLTLEAQYFGENLYDEIVKLCTEHNVGFKILPVYPGGFEFSLYFGVDRSYSQNENPWVVFSSKYGNLISSNYTSSFKNLKNAALVGGQDDGSNRVTVAVSVDNSQGLSRREIFVDAYGVVDEESQDGVVSESYENQLRQKAEEELANTNVVEAFDGEVDTSLQYVYGKDFYLGDIIQIANDYGMEVSSRISEIVVSYDETGRKTVPTFTVTSDDRKEQAV